MISIREHPRLPNVLLAEVSGARNEFYADIGKIRALPGAYFDNASKAWMLSTYVLPQILVDIGEDEIDWKTPLWKIKGEDPPTFDHLDIELDIKEKDLFKGEIIPYQTVGACFLYQRKRAICADDVGLGKTIEAIRASLKGIVDGTINNIIVFTKSSLKNQWASEIVKFTDESVLVIDGTAAKRKKLWRQAEDYRFVIVNYDLLLRKDLEAMKSRFWDCMILDEAHAVSNDEAKRTQMIGSTVRLPVYANRYSY